jgi:hypothetical protein
MSDAGNPWSASTSKSDKGTTLSPRWLAGEGRLTGPRLAPQRLELSELRTEHPAARCHKSTAFNTLSPSWERAG